MAEETEGWPSRSDHEDALVVGGGLAGISAALELQRLGRRVLVVERSSRLGGKAGATQTSLGTFPTGPTSFNGRHPSFWRLLELLGLSEEATRLRPASSARYIVRDGKLQGLRPHPLSVLGTGALSLGDKWALAKEFISPAPARADGADESLEALLVRRFGQKTVDHFLSAVMTGIFAGDLRALSAQACMPALVTAEKEYGSVLKGALKAMRTEEPGARAGLYTFAQGFGVIGDRAVKRLRCSLETEIDAVSIGARGVTLRGRRGGEAIELRAASLIVATEADVAAKLLGKAMPAAAAVLGELQYAPVTLVQWAEKTPGESRLPLGFGYLAAPVENLFALGTLFVGDLLEESPRRFSTFVGGALNRSRAEASDAELLTGVQADLRRLTGGTVGQVMQIIRWPRAVFQPAVGHATQIARLRAAVQGSPVTLAGSYFGGAAMKDAIVSGFSAAEQLGLPLSPDPLPRRGEGGSRMSPPLAVVGVSWRSANTAVRSRLAALAQEAEPIASLRQAGYVTGAACVTTCSRTEWIITSDQPEWAGNLLRGAIASRFPELGPELVQVRAGSAAVHYLLRVAVGLDSVAEGEGAVGRQLLKAFELARSSGISDSRLHRVWKHVERLIHSRRDEVPGAPSLGVQSLVREVLHERPVKQIAVLGRGEFGQAMERSLKAVAGWEVTTFTRQSMDTLFSQLGDYDALVVCTGASTPWLTLPARRKAGMVIDAGAPPQVKSAPGWTTVGLDTLLSRPELHLTDVDRERLGELVHAASNALTTELAAPAPASALAAIDAERFTFLNEQLPQLLVGLPAKQARRVRQAVGAFTHQLLKKTREAS